MFGWDVEILGCWDFGILGWIVCVVVSLFKYRSGMKRRKEEGEDSKMMVERGVYILIPLSHAFPFPLLLRASDLLPKNGRLEVNGLIFHDIMT